jgi:molybdate transport system substrate-binding protein
MRLRGLGVLGMAVGALCAQVASAPWIAAAAGNKQVLFFVDASAQEPALVLARIFGDRHPGTKVVVRADASGRLSREVLIGGARADILLFADEATMDPLEGAELLDRSTRRDLLENDLVVIGTEEGPASLASPRDLAAPEAGAIALCDTDDPLGGYARAFLEGAGVWPAVASRVTFVTDSRAARAAVETGVAAFSIVYTSQVREAKWIRAVWTIPPGAHPPIRYPVALLLRGTRRPEVRDFHKFLLSSVAARVFAANGFRLVGAGAPPVPTPVPAPPDTAARDTTLAPSD